MGEYLIFFESNVRLEDGNSVGDRYEFRLHNKFIILNLSKNLNMSGTEDSLAFIAEWYDKLACIEK